MNRLSHFRVGFPWSWACLLTVTCAAALAQAADAPAKPAPAPAPGAPAKAPAADNPLADGEPVNPLLEEDEPFVGTFKGQGMSVQIRTGKDGSLEGTVQKGTRTFPLAAKRQGQSLTGHFTHNENHFTFIATLEGKTLLFTSSDRLFKLTRDEAAAAAIPAIPVPAPVPAPPPVPVPAPAPTPTPSVPLPKPPTPTPTPTTPDGEGPPKPAGPPPFVSNPAAAAQLIPKGAKANPGKSWAGFPTGTYVMMEEESTKPNELPTVNRSVLVFFGTDNGKELILPHQFNGTRWAPIGVPSPWLGGGKTPVELGYKPGQPTIETLNVKGVGISAIVTPYSRQDPGNGGKIMNAQLQVWTVKDFEFPSQPVILPEGVLRVEGPIVRVVRTGDDGTSLDFQLVATNVPHRIGQVDITLSVFQGKGAANTPQGKLEVNIERALSPQVPGGMVKMNVETLLGGNLYLTKGAAIEVGMSKVDERQR